MAETPNPLVVVRTEVANDVPMGRGLWLWCPGCELAHRPRAANEDGSRPDSGPYWEWNECTDEAFTISPSLLVQVTYGPLHDRPGDHRCHSFIRDGQWQFLGDCTHGLAGQTVPMVPVPDWVVRRGQGDYS